MLEPTYFLNFLKDNDLTFFAGVPDSLLKDFCACVDDELPKQNHIITANEGGAVAVASGYHLATNKIPVVYMQNSGLGNAINPLVSLADPEVYSIPMLLVVGWRGEPGTTDEPQHIKQGPITEPILSCLGIPTEVLPDEQGKANNAIKLAIDYVKKHNSPYCFLVQKGTFAKYGKKSISEERDSKLTREQALDVILDQLPKETVYVGTTGKLSRELYELRKHRGELHNQDFLTVGSMGHASQIALGIAEAKSSQLVCCLDGDGAALMHLGGMATIGDRSPKNLIHCVFNNGVHESVGGQKITGKDIDFTSLVMALGYKIALRASSKEELALCLEKVSTIDRPALIEIVIKSGSREDLGRPTTTPVENKHLFQDYLNL